MKTILHIVLFFLIYNTHLISQTYFSPEYNSTGIPKNSERYNIINNGIRRVNASDPADSAVITHDKFSKVRFGIQAGTAIPAGEYADKGEKGGLAEFGYAAGIKLLFNPGFLFIADFTFTSNTFEAEYSSSCDFEENSYRSYWFLFGVGMPVRILPEVIMTGSLHVGTVVSRRSEIFLNFDRDKFYRQCPPEVTSLGYGADLSFLIRDHYSVGIKGLFAKSEHVNGDSRHLRPAIMNISCYIGYLF